MGRRRIFSSDADRARSWRDARAEEVARLKSRLAEVTLALAQAERRAEKAEAAIRALKASRKPS
jgi:hypothetical protein